MEPGIYAITNTITGEQYVGSARLLPDRWRRHKYALRTHTHPTRRLQAAWDTYGPDAFTFTVLEETTVWMPNNILPIEREWIARLKPAYNATWQETLERQLAAWVRRKEKRAT